MKLVRYRVNPQPTYSGDEVKRILAACDTRTREGIRERALVMDLFDTGVREGELVVSQLWNRKGKGGEVWIGRPGF